MKYDKQTPRNLEDHLGYWLRCLSNFVSQSFAEKLEKRSVTVAQWVVLRTLYDKEDMTLNEIAQKVGVDKSAMSRMIERLLDHGLVMREGAESDKRFLRISLTKEARELIPELASLADDNDEEFFKALSDKEREGLLNLIKLLLKSNGWNPDARGKDRMG